MLKRTKCVAIVIVLAAISAGVAQAQTKITAYGYAGDTSPDSNSANGIGNHDNQLSAFNGSSGDAALSAAAAQEYGVSIGQTFTVTGTNEQIYTLRYEDTAPESDSRIDIYDPNQLLTGGTNDNNFSTSVTSFNGDPASSDNNASTGSTTAADQKSLAQQGTTAPGAAWNIGQIVSATRAGSNVVYEALIPWVFLAAFGMLIYEAFKVFQGSTSSLTGALLRIAVAVGLLTNFHTWTGEIGSAINDTASSIGNGQGQEQLMATYASILKNPGGSNNNSGSGNPVAAFWQYITNAQAAVGDSMLRVLLWLLGIVAYGLSWLMLLLQQFLLQMTIAAAPAFIGLWMLTGTRSIGMRYFLTLVSLELWPLGWALGNIVTKELLAAVNSTGGFWLQIAASVFVVLGLWIVINAVFWPLAISKVLISGGSHALNWMTESMSPVISAGQQAANVATTMASGGSGAAVRAGGPSLASRPSGSPKV
jgi:hypothetical protein